MPKSSVEKPPAHTEKDKIAFGAQLATARKKAGLSLDAVANTFREDGHPLSKAAIGHWETGKNLPDALWLRRLARLYKTSSDELLFGAEEANLPEDFEQLIVAVSKLSDEWRDQILGTMRGTLNLAQKAKVEQKGLDETATSEHMNAKQRSVKRM